MTIPVRRQKFRLLPLIPLVALGGLGLYGLGKYTRGVFIEPKPPLAETGIAPNAAASSQAALPLPRVNPASVSQDVDPWKLFTEKFGNELQVQWGVHGRAVSVHGAPGKGERAGTDYRSDDPELAIARAREVLKAARGILGIESRLPLEFPVAKSGEVSSQVYFQESYEGVPLAPVGTVTVDLGSQGEVLNIHADYTRDVKIVNERKLSAEQARAVAVSAIPDQAASLTTVGGNPIIWVPRGQDGVPAGRQAYEYNVQGRQVIVDASNGEVIFRRDRRNF